MIFFPFLDVSFISNSPFKLPSKFYCKERNIETFGCNSPLNRNVSRLYLAHLI